MTRTRSLILRHAEQTRRSTGSFPRLGDGAAAAARASGPAKPTSRAHVKLADKERYLGVEAYFRNLALAEQHQTQRKYSLSHLTSGSLISAGRFIPAASPRLRTFSTSGTRSRNDDSGGKRDRPFPISESGNGSSDAPDPSPKAPATSQPPPPRSPQPHESPGASARSAAPVQPERLRQALQDQSSQEAFHNYPRSLRQLALQVSNSRRQEQEHGAAASASESADRTIGKSDAQGQEKEDSGSTSESGSASTGGSSSSRHWHRPTKEDLLRFARGFWTRLRIRFKWFTIRSFRRFNADDISAFFTLGSVGTIIWVVVGTTTFVSVVFAALNALNLQQWMARKLADYLTAETGVTVVFESAIVPKWKDSRISFKNVFISRRAHGRPEALKRDRLALLRGGRRLRRGRGRGTASTAGEGMAWEGMHYEDEEVSEPMSDAARGIDEDQLETEVNNNFTMFDLNVDSIDVQLSFSMWWDGKGILKDAVIRGVRGIVDRRNVHWDPEKPYDPKAARRQHRRGDFELESLEVEDVLVSIYQPGDFRPFNFSVFSARLPRLRKQWIFYDMISAESMTGQVDGCLFSLHKPQSIGKTTQRERDLNKGRWDLLSRIRIDGVNIDHIQSQQAELSGPMAWITSGKFDVVADIRFPREIPDDVDINAIISEIASNISGLVHGDTRHGENDSVDRPIPGQHLLSTPAIEAPVTTVGQHAQRTSELPGELAAQRREKGSPAISVDVEDAVKEAKEEAETKLVIPPPTVVIDIDIRFKDVKAAVPLFAKDLSYRNNALMRPIVAFMNANRTLIPVHARIVMDLSEFDGSMDLAQTGLLPLMSEKVYEALANHVASQNANQQRLRNVSAWSLRILADSTLRLVREIRDVLTRTHTHDAALQPS